MTALDDIKATLGEAVYDRNGVLIYEGDCLELMAKLDQPMIDLTVTSPPYNIGKEYETKLTTEAYVAWAGKWMTEIHRITAAHGTFWLNLGYVAVEPYGRAVPLPYLLWDRSPFYLLQEVVWSYGAGVAAKNSFSPRNEKFLWYLKDRSNYVFNLDDVRDPDVKYPNQMKNGKLRCNPLGKNPGDVWALPKVTSGRNRSSVERMPHPAQFPEAVIERIILASSNPGDLILDPFLGSGTTAAVASRLGRLCVGFELRSDYVATAMKRVDAVMAAAKIEELQFE